MASIMCDLMIVVFLAVLVAAENYIRLENDDSVIEHHTYLRNPVMVLFKYQNHQIISFNKKNTTKLGYLVQSSEKEIKLYRDSVLWVQATKNQIVYKNETLEEYSCTININERCSRRMVYDISNLRRRRIRSPQNRRGNIVL